MTVIQNMFLGVYKKVDKRSLRESVHQLLDFLVMLRAYKPGFFSELYAQGPNKEETLRQKIAFNYDTVRKGLTCGSGDEDDFSDIGFFFDISNGKEGFEEMLISANLGDDRHRPPNHFTILLPASGEVYAYYQDKEHRLELLKIMVDYWQPDFIKINNREKRIYPPFSHFRLKSNIETGSYKLC